MKKLQPFFQVKNGYTQLIATLIIFSPSLTYLPNLISLIGICLIAIISSSAKISNRFS